MTQIKNAHAYQTGYTACLPKKNRSKSDWAGCGLGDAFKHAIEYMYRLKAQRDFYKILKTAQKAIAKLTDPDAETNFQPRVKAQLSPIYTDYPAPLAAFASIGLTCFLEYQERTEHNLLLNYLADFLENPAEIDGLNVDIKEYKQVVNAVCTWVWTRLVLEDLARTVVYSPLEIYSLFISAQETLKFDCLSEIIRAVILFGDILPPWDLLKLHPLTAEIIQETTKVSKAYFLKIREVPSKELIMLGAQWARVLSKTLSKFLPPPKPPDSDKEKELFAWLDKDDSAVDYDVPSFLRKKADSPKGRPRGRMTGYQRYLSRVHGIGNPDHDKNEHINPLNGPNPPSLDPPKNLAHQIVKAQKGKDEKSLSIVKDDPQTRQLSASETMEDFNTAINRAGRQINKWEDMRHDIIKNLLRDSPFKQGPVEGLPADGHDVSVKLGGGLEAGGEIYDQPAEVSDDYDAIAQLSDAALLITRALKKNLYPNVAFLPVAQHLQTNGLIDNRRLPLAAVSGTVFKRYRHTEIKDQRGRPLLLIACDGSGSLNSQEMYMLKLLCTSYLESTVKSQIQILAALYHSDRVRSGAASPLVRWIYHSQKNLIKSPKEGVRAVAALPDSGGTGVQSDALSLSFLLQEGRRLAKGSMVYLVLITDSAWNRSFHMELSGKEEVRAVFKNAYEEFAGKLDTTVIALGVSEETGLEDMVQKVIAVSEKQLEDPGNVAREIALYVAACIRDRKKIVTH